VSNAVPIPKRISRLTDLADNLWWSWRPPARNLFKVVSYPLWKSTRHNPVRMLQLVSPERLETLARDPDFLAQYDQVVAAYDADLADGHLWFRGQQPDLLGQVAYFSAEFGLHGSLPIYSGGLGAALSGEHCKEASDLGLPFVGVGFIYPQGYFRQHIPPDGWQAAVYDTLNFGEVPLHLVYDLHDQRGTVQVTLRGVPVHVQVWEVRVGRARLYGGGQETRIRQEMVLGLGGVRVLQALGVSPSAWHMNEGHSAFLVLERLRELTQGGHALEEAIDIVRRTTVFTAHTPVPAGHDAFLFHMMDEYFGRFWHEMGISREQFLALGEYGGRFNMTVLASRLSGQSNGVSRIHGDVSRRMWQPVWPGRPVEQVPIGAITNGVHVPSWISTEIKGLFAEYLGTEWEERHDAQALWDRVYDIPDEALWAVHRQLRAKLLAFIGERTRQRWRGGAMDADQVLASGTLLDPEALTIGFARRFATYKRAALIFRDVRRLKRILHAERRPVQMVFAGKAHPADGDGKKLIREVYQFAQDPESGGRIAFLEDYELNMARFLVQGVDVWLNNPRRSNRASGTSGMKPAMNGVPNLSVLDGWWPEAYRPPEGDEPPNGWAWGEVRYDDWEAQDEVDSQALYRILEEQVVPLYYDRDAVGIPHRWAQVMKEAIRTSVATFGARRMVKEYIEQMYVPAMRQS
jgi:starch phosphorylase